MSKESNQIVTVWEDVEDFLRRNYIHVRMNGESLPKSQVEILHNGLSLLVMCWHDMLSDLEGYSTRWVRPWLNTIVNTDLKELLNFLKSADMLLLDSVQSSVTDYDDFKHRLTEVCPVSGALLGPLKKRLTRWLCFSDPVSFSAIHECLVFMTRLSLPGLPGLIEDAHASYFANEKKLKEWSVYTDQENALIKRWFPLECSDYLYDSWHPKHGPGSVADLMKPLKKKRGSSRDDYNYIVRSSAWSIEKYQQLGTDQNLRYLNLRLGVKSGIPWACNPTKRVSKVVFVPKSVDKLRTICAEPSALQWYQQGFLRSIVTYIENPPRIISRKEVFQCTLERRISLKRQDLSRALARLGSERGDYATIDLSSASDSVSWQMMKKWLRGSALAAIAYCTRSKSWTVDGKLTFKNEKFAPMGSSLCFPFECIIFCAIIECAIVEAGGRVCDSNYRVYGDDIIVEKKYAYAVMRRLIVNGFLVNRRKSFYDSGTHNFREACGGEYLDGMDVSPVRLSRKFKGFSNLSTYSASEIADLVDLCNTSYDTLPSVRRRVVAALMQLPPDLRPLFRSPEYRRSHVLDVSTMYLMAKIDSSYHRHFRTNVEKSWVPVEGTVVSSYTATNFHLKLEPFDDPRGEKTTRFRHGVLSVTESIPVGFEYEDIRYFEWLRSAAVRYLGDINDPYEATTIDLPGALRWLHIGDRRSKDLTNRLIDDNETLTQNHEAG